MDQRDMPESAEPRLAKDAFEMTEANENTDPTDSTDPTLPIERIE